MLFNLSTQDSEVIALVDCNNFYVSCERVFNPRLKNKPVVVLSNNDGCAIARSQEAKALGIKMAQPFFEWEEMVKKYDIQVYSSNFSLYADMSHRVMEVLKEFTPYIEYYSIDEAFLNLTHIKKDYCQYAQYIMNVVFQKTGLPVSIGISTTKTLAKIANTIAKRGTGVCCLLTDVEYKYHLVNYPVGKIWGVGRNKARWLKDHGISYAYDLSQCDIAWVRKHLTVVTARTVMELKGISCKAFEYEVPDKKEVATTRSFGRNVSAYAELQECISAYTASIAWKVRQQKGCIGYLRIFIESSRFKKNHYAKAAGCVLDPASSDTSLLITYARGLLKSIYKKGVAYRRAGAIGGDLSEEYAGSDDLFQNKGSTQKSKAMMKVIDQINHKCKQVYLASEGNHRAWCMKQHMLSPKYTTKLSDVMVVPS